jgi:hypothetical protein
VRAGSNSNNIKRLGRKSKASVVATKALKGTMVMIIKTATTANTHARQAAPAISLLQCSRLGAHLQIPEKPYPFLIR